MFPYDAELVAAVAGTPQSVADVVRVLESIEAVCADGDGLKWFNWLYLQVTLAIQTRVNSPGGLAGPAFSNPAWIAALDVTFAGFYFSAVREALTSGVAPGCWQAVFDVRSQPAITRIQFAFAGMNAHINRDLPRAIVGLCQATGIAPVHGTTQYNDYTAVNATLDAIINAAKQELNVRLAGDSLPDVTHLENLVAAWSISGVREIAWKNAEVLWHIKDVAPVSATFLDSVDAATAVASKTLLVPVP